MTESSAPYDLRMSPFFELRASPRDDRSRLVQLSESVELPATRRAQLRSELLNLRRRVTWEVAWDPNGAPQEMSALLAERSGDRLDSLLEGRKLSPMARANLRAHCAVDVLFPETPDVAVGWIVALVDDSASVSIPELMSAINADRETGHFAPVTAVEWIETAVIEREKAFASAVCAVLDRLPPDALVAVLTAAVERITHEGENPGPSTLERIIERYSIETEFFRSTELERVRELAAYLGSTRIPVEQYRVLQGRLSRMVRRWDSVAQPIQLARQATGRDDPMSVGMAESLRDAAIQLHNQHGMLNESRDLMLLIADVFRELPIVANRASEDGTTIEVNRYIRGSNTTRRRPPASAGE